MGRSEDEGWQGQEAFAIGLHSMSEEEDTMLRREACMQPLHAISHAVRLQGDRQKGGAKNRLHGNAGSEVEKDGG